MKTRKLRNLEVSAIGYGCMGLSHGYGATKSKEESLKLIRYAYELGCNFFDTAEGYGAGENEILTGEALKHVRKNVIIATKFFIQKAENSKLFDEMEAHVDDSLKRLNTDYIDLYYQHRISKDIPVEEVAYCMGKLIEKGKILAWGQSQSTVEEITNANKITPISAIQSEYSIMERMFEKDVIPTCEKLGIGFVPFSPLASGFLSGKYNENTKYSGDDVRRAITRFSKENVIENKPLLEFLNDFAKLKNSTPAQISLAWMLHKNNFIVPIPGSRSEERIKENFEAMNVELTEEEFNKIEEELSKINIHGNRTDEDIAKLRNMD